MKKIIWLPIIISSLLISLNSIAKPVLAQGSASGEVGANIIIGLIEDQLMKESAEEVSNILKDMRDAAKEAGAIRDTSRLLSTIDRNTGALLKAAQHMPLTRCKHLISEAKIQQIIGSIDKFNSMLCNNMNARQRTYFYPMAKHCISPNDLACVCSHPSHRNAPACAGITGPEEPMCLSDDDFADSLNRLAEIFDDNIDNITHDDNDNGMPDICENNRKSR